MSDEGSCSCRWCGRNYPCGTGDWGCCSKKCANEEKNS